MAKNTTLAAGTSPFAHLLGGAAALAGRAFGSRAEEDEQDPAAEVDDADPDAEDDSTDEPEKGKRGKKAKGEAEDDDADAEEEDDDVSAEEPEDEKEAKAFRAGVAAERKRCAEIFSSPAAAGRPDLAATLAFATSQSSAEAIAVLGAANTGAPRARGRLDDRMGNRADPKPGGGTGATGKTGFADRVANAVKKAGR